MFRHTLRTVSRPGARPLCRPMATRSYATANKTAFDWEDPLGSKNLLTEEELAIGETAERYCQERMMPRVLRTFILVQSIFNNLVLSCPGVASLHAYCLSATTAELFPVG